METLAYMYHLVRIGSITSLEEATVWQTASNQIIFLLKLRC